MSLTYTTFVAGLANFLVVPSDDTNFVAAVPNIIDDAEQRLYRDLDLLRTVSAAIATFNPVTPVLQIPLSGFGTPFEVLQDVVVVTPLGADPVTGGASTPLFPTSKEGLRYLFPDNTETGVPAFFAPFNQATILVGPRPDAAYSAILYGTARPQPLSVSNTTTILTSYFPDLFLTAGLSIGAGYLKDFGAATDDPQSGMSWEKKYQRQLSSAVIEEARKKFSDQGFGSGPNREAKQLGVGAK